MPAHPAGSLSRLYRVQGTVAVPPGRDAALLLPHVMADLQRRGCPARLTADGVLLVEGRSERRGSVLGFVDGGWIRRAPRGAWGVLDYEFSTLGGLKLCGFVAGAACLVAWFALESAGLAAFGLFAPLLWLYGANRVMTAIRVPGLLEQLCRSAPGLVGEAGQTSATARAGGP